MLSFYQCIRSGHAGMCTLHQYSILVKICVLELSPAEATMPQECNYHLQRAELNTHVTQFIAHPQPCIITQVVTEHKVLEFVAATCIVDSCT
jgi:hypothetical protein